MADVINFKINSKNFDRRFVRLMKTVVIDSKEIRAAMKRSTNPWKSTMNSSIYKYVQRIEGKLGRSMGQSTFYSSRKQLYGAKVRPIPLRKSGNSAGWRVHFFATPARQIRKSKRIPFQAVYSTQTPKVISLLKGELNTIFKKYFKL